MIVEVEVGEEKEEIVQIGGPDHMIDPAHMIDQVHMTGQRAERDQIVEIEVGIEVVETKVEIKIQETKGTIQELLPNCYKLQNILKKKGVSLNEVTRKNMSEQEKYQMFMEFKTYMDTQDPTN